MNIIKAFHKQAARVVVSILGLAAPLSFCPDASAYPPAPYHLIYGLVRDRYGTPLASAQAQIILQPISGPTVSSAVIPGLIPGVNYQIKVPMDSSSTLDLYQPNVLIAGTSFKVLVVIGTVTNIPIEMTVSNVSLGLPARSTRIDLTLGVDSNGDGLPDAWEAAFLATLGLNLPLSSINANSVLTPDGLTLRQQYVLGTYPFDPDNPLNILFTGFNNGYPVLQFPTVTGRSYTVLSSADMKNWTPVTFFLASDGLNGPARTYYYASGISTIQVYVVPPVTGTPAQFYRISVQ